MLSLTGIGSVGQTVHYFESDNYYTRDADEADRAGRWFGDGAKALGLDGRVAPETFKALLSGKLPDGTKVGKLGPDGELKHRPGWDLTLSAPKGVSFAALVLGDTRVIDAHQRAVETAMREVEKHVAYTRVGRDARPEYTQRLVIAQFLHDSSRNLDPQLHTHNVVMNLTQRADGQWRSIESRPLYQQQIHVGSMYQAELAREMQRLGYEIERTHDDGRFEVRGIPQALLEHFSSRRKEIEASIQERQLTGRAGAEKAALMTRVRKQNVERETLVQTWREQVERLGFNLERIQREAVGGERKRLSPEDERSLSDEAVRWAAEKLSERDAVFSARDLVREAQMHAFGDVSKGTVEASVKDASIREIILDAVHRDTRGFTTQRALDMERATIRSMRRGQEASRSILGPYTTQWVLERSDLSPGQKAGAAHFLRSQDRVIGIQGYAGVGKTYMMAFVAEQASQSEYKVRGMAPSASAADVLGKESGIESETVSRFLLRENEAFGRREVWVVDEASLLSNRQMHDLVRKSEAVGAKLVLMGDTKQLEAVEAGRPFALLQKEGMRTAENKDIRRQREAYYRQAVLAAIEGDARKSLWLLKDKVVEISDRQERLKSVADFYLSATPDQRDKTLLAVPGREDRDQLNQMIRERLREEGALGEGRVFSTLVSVDRTQKDLERASHYEVGMVAKFFMLKPDEIGAGLRRDEYWRVAKVDRERNLVTVKDTEGREVQFNPVDNKLNRRVGLFKERSREIAAGDRIRWTHNVDAKLRNNAQLEVIKVVGDRVTFRDKDGETFERPISEMRYRHFDYNIASTLYAAQGRTADRVITMMEERQVNNTNQRSFYVAISRGREEAWVFVDNRDRVAEAIRQRDGSKSSALEGRRLAERLDRDGHIPDVSAAVDRSRELERTSQAKVRDRATARELSR